MPALPAGTHNCPRLDQVDSPARDVLVLHPLTAPHLNPRSELRHRCGCRYRLSSWTGHVGLTVLRFLCYASCT